MDRKQRIDHYIQRLSDKKFQIYDVRLELEQEKVDEDEIKTIVRAVDEELQSRLLSAHNRGQTSGFIRIGIIMMVIGAAMTIGAFTGILNIEGFMFLTYVPFLIGLSMLLVGFFKRKGKNFGRYPARSVEESSEKRNISLRRNTD